MAEQVSDQAMVSEGRALLTEREREILTGEAAVKSNYRYKVESTVRKRIEEEFPVDADVLRENHPEIFDILRDTVCGLERFEVGFLSFRFLFDEDFNRHKVPIQLRLSSTEDGLIAADSFVPQTGRFDIFNQFTEEERWMVTEAIQEEEAIELQMDAGGPTFEVHPRLTWEKRNRQLAVETAEIKGSFELVDEE